ncbi:MAG: DPP IV N-terminal domain-containing protein [bacterium]
MFWNRILIIYLLFIIGCSNTNLQVKDIIWIGHSDESNYSWSNDGQWVAFGCQGNLWIANIEGRKFRLTFNNGKDPSWSPDNNKILYIFAGNLWVNDINSFKDIQLTTDGKSSEVRWSPDGRAIVFVKEGNIWVMNSDGSGQRQLTTGNDCNHPLFSPMGDKIAFSSSRSGGMEADIWLIHPDGTPLRKLSKGGKNMVWSPDGSKIICSGPWTDGRYYGHAFYIIDVTTQKVKSIKILETTPPLFYIPLLFSSIIIGDINYTNYSLSWSPNGSRIVFDNEIRRKTNIYAISSSGRDLCQLTSTGDATRPVWSPDGNKIMFKSGDNIGILVLSEQDK